MSPLIVFSIGVLLFAGIYLMLSNQLWRVIIGTVFLSHGVNLILLASGGFMDGTEPPILHASKGPFVDPLPQALILTAIVISFGVTAFVLVMLRQVYESTGTTDLKEIEENEWGEEHGSDHHD